MFTFINGTVFPHNCAIHTALLYLVDRAKKLLHGCMVQLELIVGLHFVVSYFGSLQRNSAVIKALGCI